MTTAAPAEPAAAFIGAGAWKHGLRYGLLGLPLAFVALPLYVILPNHYAREFAAPLAALGAVAHQPLDAEQLRDLRHGRPLRATVGGERAALLRDGQVVAMAVRSGSDRWQPRVVLLGDDAS